MTRKRAKSYTGHHVDLANVSHMAGTQEAEPLKVNESALADLGGERLRTLFLTGMNFGLAAIELKIEEATLRKWFDRWKKSAVANGLRPEDLLQN